MQQKSWILGLCAVLLVGGSTALVGAPESGGDMQITNHPVHEDKEDCSHDEHNKHNDSGSESTGCSASTEQTQAPMKQASSMLNDFFSGIGNAFSNLFGSMPNNPPEPQGDEGGEGDEDSTTGSAYQGEAA